MIRLVIADDHAVVRRGLEGLIEDLAIGMEVVACCATADDLFVELQSTPTDVLLLDISMPGPGVAATIAKAKRLRPKLRILVMSVYAEKDYAPRAFQWGASGYVSKDRSPEELVEALAKVASGRNYVSDELAEKLAADLRSEVRGELHESLSNREFQVLCLLGAGKSIKEIAHGMDLSPRTISTYKARILEKMRATSLAELVRYVVLHNLTC